jgi:hypothetical protein
MTVCTFLKKRVTAGGVVDCLACNMCVICSVQCVHIHKFFHVALRFKILSLSQARFYSALRAQLSAIAIGSCSKKFTDVTLTIHFFVNFTSRYKIQNSVRADR